MSAPQEDRLSEALAAAGAAIQDIEPDQRHDTARKFLVEQQWMPDGMTRQNLNFLVGVFVSAHEWRLEREQWTRSLHGSASDAEIQQAAEALRKSGCDVPPKSVIGRILDSARTLA